MATVRFDIVTPFPEAFASYLGVSILKRAMQKRLISVCFTNPRNFTRDRHRTLDNRPYGGGAGMVLMAEPILKAAVAALRKIKNQEAKSKKTKIALLSAKGKQFNQRMASDWAKRYGRLILISGRYEGIDERVRKILKADEVSIGPYVLTDGDVAAMAVISAVARLIPGVIKLYSLEEESHWNLLGKQEAAGGLEYPHYTRPETLLWQGKRYRVPHILLSGNHRKIATWRAKHRR